MGKLILVGVPIGNFEDLAPRALSCFQQTDLILCEDTRETSKLLINFGLEKKLISYVGSYNKAVSEANKYLQEKKMVVLVSDRGMPSISDPGAKIISKIDVDYELDCVPGPCSVTTAFCLSGYFGGYVFHGFLPRKTGAINKVLKNLATLEYNLIFFEAPKRLKNTLEIFDEIFPNRNITIARELTKKYQQVTKGKAKDLLKQEFKGECVIIVEKAN